MIVVIDANAGIEIALLYLTLARRTGATLITLDKKLVNLAKDCGIETQF